MVIVQGTYINYVSAVDTDEVDKRPIRYELYGSEYNTAVITFAPFPFFFYYQTLQTSLNNTIALITWLSICFSLHVLIYMLVSACMCVCICI